MFKAATIYTVNHSGAGRARIADRANWRVPLPHDPHTIGLVRPEWAPADGAPFVELGNQCVLLLVKYSWREVPADVLREEVAKRLDGQRVSRKERQRVKDEAVFDLLPKAFIKHKITPVILMPHRLIVGAAGASEVDRTVEFLTHHVYGSLHLEPAIASAKVTPGRGFTAWVRDDDGGPVEHLAMLSAGNGHASDYASALERIECTKGQHLQLGDECVLQSGDGRAARFKGIDLPADEPYALTGQGFRVAQLAVVNGYGDRFVVDDRLRFKRTKFADRPEGETAEDQRAQLLAEVSAIGMAAEAFQVWLGVSV